MSLCKGNESDGTELGEKYLMDQASTSPDRLAKTVFWIVMFSAVAFVLAVLILIR